MKRLDIVIVNYRTAPLVLECLRSLSQEPLGRAIVVDNASGDGSAEMIQAAIEREGWSAWATTVPLQRNGGYAAGNNAGIRLALSHNMPADWVLLLNPDTVVRPGAIATLMQFMEQHPRVGIAGSRLEDAAGVVQWSAHQRPSPVGELEEAARCGIVSRWLHRYRVSPPVQDQAHPCDWVSGASLIVRRELLEEIGFLDEGFFLYYEEVDFCWRARCAGWEVWYVPQSRVMHLEGVATGIKVARKRRARYWYESRRRFFLKHYRLPGLLAADALWAVGRSAWLARRCLGLARPATDPQWFSWDLLGGDLGAILRGEFHARCIHDR